MKQLLKISNADLSYRLNLNYNNVYSRLKMLLGKKASLFADISTKSSGVVWYSDDDADYSRLSEAPKEDVNNLSVALNDAVSAVRKELSGSPELTNYVDDILEVPDNNFVFYRKDGDTYKFILAGWGCKYAHQSTNDPNSGFIKRISKNLEIPETPSQPARNKDISQLLAGSDEDVSQNSQGIQDANNVAKGSDNTTDKNNTMQSPHEHEVTVDEKLVNPEPEQPVKKTQHVVLRVVDQNSNPVDGESVHIVTSAGEINRMTSEKGLIDVGNFPYGDSFGVTFPNISGNQERTFEVEPGVETYDAFIKKLVKYMPLLFIEDQNGNAVQDYNVKVVIKGQDTVYNSGMDGVIQLPVMLEGQKFVVIDTANYANTEEYNVTQKEAKAPYHFHIKTAEKSKVGITVINKSGKPVPKASVSLQIGDTPCQQQTGEDGRAEFPYDVFIEGDIPVSLSVGGRGKIKSNLQFTSDITEYTIQLQNRNEGHRGSFDWKWLAIIPLLLLFGWGGKELYEFMFKKKTTIAEMESGVCLILGQGYYYVDLQVKDITIGGHPAIAYFNYDENTREVTNLTFDPEKATIQSWWGTGFLISNDGLIATNRHIAAPIAPESVGDDLKKWMQDQKDMFQRETNRLNDKLQILGGLGNLGQEYLRTRDTLQFCQEQVSIYDNLLNLGKFKVEVKCVTSVAFTNTQIENEKDFIDCSQPRAVGDPGGVKEKDLAIIQIKKKNDIPIEAFVFTVPEKDLMDSDIPDDYEVTVLGYNAGGNIQDMKLQDGLKPQAQHGKITNRSEKFRVGYDAPTLGGSSGSPVINKDGQLVAINNSGIGGTQGFNYGIRTKYLRELLDEVQKKQKK